MAKMCELCRLRPATVPDRNRPGRLVNRVCTQCHGRRLVGDLRHIIALDANGRAKGGIDLPKEPIE
jgi:hypothetical protein